MSSIVLFFIFMVVWCGVKATFTDPGLVVDPIVWNRRTWLRSGCFGGGEEVLQTRRIVQLLCVGFQGNLFSRKCDCMKPARAHHCSKCGVCILKMDHHCPFLQSHSFTVDGSTTAWARETRSTSFCTSSMFISAKCLLFFWGAPTFTSGEV